MPMMPGARVASTSMGAFKALVATGGLTHLEEVVLACIEGFGATGCTYDEVQEKLPHLPNSVSGRFKSLERKGWMVREGDTRPGRTGNPQKVMRHSRFAKTAPVITPTRNNNPYLAGLMKAAKLVLDAGDYDAAKKALGSELRRVAKP